MDFGKINEAPNSKLIHDFDLNIACNVEEFDVKAENEFPAPSQNSIENMKIEENAIANNGDVKDSDTTIQANSAAAEPNNTTASSAPARISQHRCQCRRHRRAESKLTTDPDTFCTNFYCQTRRTPMWRKGPLGPKTLCNACGLQYLKRVKGTAAPSDHEGDGLVPAAQTVEAGDSVQISK